MPLEDLQEECAALMVAGSDTTSLALTWFIYELLKNPIELSKLKNEIRSKRKKDQIISYKKTLDLKYFNVCLKETLRMYPVASHPIMRAVLAGGAKFNEFSAKEGTEIITNCFTIQNDERVSKEPRKLNPNRFFDDSDVTDSFLTFSSGPRGCVGRSLAWTEMLITLVNLFNRFDMEFQEQGFDIDTVCFIILVPKGFKDIRVKFIERA